MHTERYLSSRQARDREHIRLQELLSTALMNSTVTRSRQRPGCLEIVFGREPREGFEGKVAGQRSADWTGQFTLFVECAWRIDEDRRLAFGSGDAQDFEATDCYDIVGLTVESIRVIPVDLDTVIRLSSSKVIYLFLTADTPGGEFTNWRFYDGRRLILRVGPGRVLNLNVKSADFNGRSV